MKPRTFVPFRWLAAFGGLAVLVCSARASAIEFNFEADSGYSVSGGSFGNGSLAGQHQLDAARPWRGPRELKADVLRIVAEPGGKQVLRAFNIEEQMLPFYIYDTTTADLGGPFDPDRSRVTFSFRIRYDDEPLSSSAALLRVSFGHISFPVMRLEFLSDGRMHFNNGTRANVLSAGANGQSTLGKKGRWIQISGAINYATKTYTLYVAGVPQRDGKTTNFGFMDPGSEPISATLALRDMAAGTGSFVAYSLDDFVLGLDN